MFGRRKHSLSMLSSWLEAVMRNPTAPYLTHVFCAWGGGVREVRRR